MGSSWRIAAAGLAAGVAGLTGCDGVFGLEFPVVPSAPCLVDDFAGPELDLGVWNRSGDVELVDEAVQIRIPANTEVYNRLESKRRFDLTGGSVTVEAVQVLSQGGSAESVLEVHADAGAVYQIHVAGGLIRFRDAGDGAFEDAFMTTYEPLAHRVWRIRHDARRARIVFGLGPEAEQPEDLFDLPARSPSTALVGLLAGAYGDDDPTPGIAIYDNVAVHGNCP